MAKTPKVYTRLTRNAAGVAAYSSLWRAADHLLVVSSTGFSESYARIMFRDIKAFFVIPSDRRMWWTITWGLPLGIAFIRMVLVALGGEWPIGSLVIFAIGLIGLVWNFALGAGCRVLVMTAVQTSPLPALVRIKRARKVLAELQPLIASAQADLVATAPVSEPAVSPAPSPSPEPPVPPVATE